MAYKYKEYVISKYTACYTNLIESVKDIQNQDIKDIVDDMVYYYNNILGMFRDDKINSAEYCYWSIASMKLIEMFLKEKLK